MEHFLGQMVELKRTADDSVERDEKHHFVWLPMSTESPHAHLRVTRAVESGRACTCVSYPLNRRLSPCHPTPRPSPFISHRCAACWQTCATFSPFLRARGRVFRQWPRARERQSARAWYRAFVLTAHLQVTCIFLFPHISRGSADPVCFRAERAHRGRSFFCRLPLRNWRGGRNTSAVDTSAVDTSAATFDASSRVPDRTWAWGVLPREAAGRFLVTISKWPARYSDLLKATSPVPTGLIAGQKQEGERRSPCTPQKWGSEALLRVCECERVGGQQTGAVYIFTPCYREAASRY